MRTIIKRWRLRDLRGGSMTFRAEVLSDDGEGTLEFTEDRTLLCCPG